MKFTEERFQAAAQIGGFVVTICAVANVYFVMRHVELYRDAVRREQQTQQLMMQQQAMEGAVREFASYAQSNPQIAEILMRYRLIQTNAVPRTTP